MGTHEETLGAFNMTTRKDGGPAFPTAYTTRDNFDNFITQEMEGATLLDYAAIKILASMIASPSIIDRSSVSKPAWCALAYD